MLAKVIYVMGAPGSGKGTQAKLLSEKLGYHQFSTGDAFRAVARQDTDLGRRVKETIDNGYLASPDMAAEIVMAAVSRQIEAQKGIVFDGTPRTVPEATIVDDFFKEKKYGIPLVIYLRVDQAEVARRNSQRRYCLNIPGDFPVVTADDSRRCVELGGTIGTRADDDPKKFETRWSEFLDKTLPVIEEYSKRGMVHEVDGMPAIPKVHERVMEIITKAKAGSRYVI